MEKQAISVVWGWDVDLSDIGLKQPSDEVWNYELW